MVSLLLVCRPTNATGTGYPLLCIPQPGLVVGPPNFGDLTPHRRRGCFQEQHTPCFSNLRAPAPSPSCGGFLTVASRGIPTQDRDRDLKCMRTLCACHPSHPTLSTSPAGPPKKGGVVWKVSPARRSTPQPVQWSHQAGCVSQTGVLCALSNFPPPEMLTRRTSGRVKAQPRLHESKTKNTLPSNGPAIPGNNHRSHPRPPVNGPCNSEFFFSCFLLFVSVSLSLSLCVCACMWIATASTCVQKKTECRREAHLTRQSLPPSHHTPPCWGDGDGGRHNEKGVLGVPLVGLWGWLWWPHKRRQKREEKYRMGKTGTGTGTETPPPLPSPPPPQPKQAVVAPHKA